MQLNLIDGNNLIGYTACLLTTFSSVPQLLKMRQTKSVNDIHEGSVIILSLGLFLWIVYAWRNKDYPLMLSALASIVIQLWILKYVFKHRD